MEETKEERQLRIWRYRLTPAQRDYDRLVAKRIPKGATWYPETEAGLRYMQELRERREEQDMLDDEGICSCHIAPPCRHCETLAMEE